MHILQLDEKAEKAIKDPILEKYEKEGHPYFASARSVVITYFVIFTLVWAEKCLNFIILNFI